MTKRTPKAPRWCRRRAASLFLAFVQMPLDAAAVAALRAEFASEHGGVTLIPDVQAALVSELAGSGEDLASCGLDVTWDDVQSWESVWATTLADAGRAKGRDKARFVQWAKDSGSQKVQRLLGGPRRSYLSISGQPMRYFKKTRRICKWGAAPCTNPSSFFEVPPWLMTY